MCTRLVVIVTWSEKEVCSRRGPFVAFFMLPWADLTKEQFPGSPLEFSEIGYLLLPSHDMAEIPLTRRNPQYNQPTDQRTTLVEEHPCQILWYGWAISIQYTAEITRRIFTWPSIWIFMIMKTYTSVVRYFKVQNVHNAAWSEIEITKQTFSGSSSGTSNGLPSFFSCFLFCLT